MTISGIYFFCGAVLLCGFSLLWLASLRLKDASIVDIAWGVSFIISAWIYFGLSQEGFLPRKLLVVSLVTIWGLRLSAYIFNRNRGRGEDFRYQNWRNQFGRSWPWRSYVQVFFLQGFLAWIISLPLLAAQYSPTPGTLTVLDWSGAALWLAGFSFETIGDWQLARFRKKSNTPGEILRTGLWKYTRHPNYFGEAVLWWGFGLVALSVPNGWIALASPILMTYLLTRVSGVRMLDNALLERKPGYRAYVQSTSAFIPWFPKSANSEQAAVSEPVQPTVEQETHQTQDSSLYN